MYELSTCAYGRNEDNKDDDNDNENNTNAQMIVRRTSHNRNKSGEREKNRIHENISNTFRFIVSCFSHLFVFVWPMWCDGTCDLVQNVVR